jgi:hypothetical protein
MTENHYSTNIINEQYGESNSKYNGALLPGDVPAPAVITADHIAIKHMLLDYVYNSP